MSRTMQYIAFYSVFFAVMWGMHLYVGLRLGRLFGCQNTWALVGFCTLVALSFPAFSLVEKFYPTTFSMLLYGAASIWLGVIFLLLSILLVYEGARFFLPLQPKAAAFTIIGIAALLSVYGILNALFITVRSVDIPMPGLARPLRIVQLSDIHVGTIHNSGFNHERYDDMDKIQSLLPAAGVEILRNRIVDFRGVQIVGVDTAMRDGEKGNNVVGTLPIDRSRPSILMYHVPVGIDDAAGAGIKLQLSGHTHNGQLFPFTLFAKLLYPQVAGLYTRGGMRLYVSPGTGTWGPPMRIGSSNEITLITLMPQQ
ncbi:MAG: hypothetical protein NTX06_01345 [Proteobacteria bacterium]|nr:hypothetical protein [Pseudomonadota bacterium]